MEVRGGRQHTRMMEDSKSKSKLLPRSSQEWAKCSPGSQVWGHSVTTGTRANAERDCELILARLQGPDAALCLGHRPVPAVRQEGQLGHTGPQISLRQGCSGLRDGLHLGGAPFKTMDVGFLHCATPRLKVTRNSLHLPWGITACFVSRNQVPEEPNSECKTRKDPLL